ncbi:MAG: hypothetical protein Q4C55_08530 [Eubacterium sp.]|nr:hypothetical protein [Eubacterium sp.]
MKCKLCKRKYHRSQIYCPGCGLKSSDDNRREGWAAYFTAVDAAGEDFDLWRWITHLKKAHISLEKTSLSAEAQDQRIRGTLPQCSGVLGDYHQVVQGKRKKRSRRLSKKKLRVRRELMLTDDSYYEDVLPEDWGALQNPRPDFDFKRAGLRFAALFGAILLSGFFMLLALGL